MHYRITEIFAYVAIDADDDEGLCAHSLPGEIFGAPGQIVFMPLVGADPARKESLRAMAQEVADASAKTIKLIRFTTRQDLEVIEPQREKAKRPIG